jgi:hypothetical protein
VDTTGSSSDDEPQPVTTAPEDWTQHSLVQVEGGLSEALQDFSKARAASALAIALSDDPTQLHEALYEAIAAMSDPHELVRVTERALQ